MNSLTKDADANITELGHCIGMVGSFVKASYTIFLQNLLGELTKCADKFEVLNKKFQEHCVKKTIVIHQEYLVHSLFLLQTNRENVAQSKGKIEEVNERITGSQKHGKVDLQKLSDVKLNNH